MCEIACQVGQAIELIAFAVTELMLAELRVCHGGSVGSRAKRVEVTSHLNTRNADTCTRYQPTANGKNEWKNY